VTGSMVSLLLPLMLALIMLYLGLTLQLADFHRVLQRPVALVVGLAGQLLLVPTLGWVLTRLLPLEPAMAVGLMILVACPGGVSSGLLTHLARGDVALSISLTAISSVAAVFTLPLIVNVSMSAWMARTAPVDLDLARMVRSIFMLTTLPVLLGMGLRAWRPRQVLCLLPTASHLASAMFVLIVLATFWEQRQVLLEQLPVIGPASLLLNAMILLGAWLLGAPFSLSGRQRVAVVTECGLQNSALGIFVALQLLQSPEMSIPSIVYALLMNGGAVVFVFLIRSRTRLRRLEPHL
jgi:BASS family bile acid:Na+ symporter